MGSSVNLRCTCGLAGNDVTVGQGMHAKWRFFESRLFYCEPCAQLTAATVLRHVAELRAELPTMDAQRWSAAEAGGDSRLSLLPSELAQLLIDAKVFPHCDCGEPLRGSVPFVEQAARCPRCAASLAVEFVAHWD